MTMLQQQEAETIVFESSAHHHVDSIQLIWDHAAVVPELRLTLTLRSDTAGQAPLALAFSGVADLKLQAALSYDDRIATLRIRDIRDRQWGDINFEVFEPDSDGLYFMCTSWHSRGGSKTRPENDEC